MQVYNCLCVVVSIISLSNCQSVSKDVFLVNQGTVRGYNSDNKDIFAFYGIPYATAPRGDDRFKASFPPPKWVEVFEATIKNIACPQMPGYEDAHLNRSIDCLVLNIFTPRNPLNLPVYIYIHGGRYQQGFGMEFSPIPLVEKEIIAVTINYRLGVHGFLCLGTEFAPGNAGMKDQVAALRWVKRNIAQFGGNPDDITVGGLSAGGMSVELLILSSMANGLFQKAISESGSALGTFINFTPLETAFQYAEQFKNETINDITEIENIYKLQSDEQLNVGFDDPKGFCLCLENHDLKEVEKFITELPYRTLRSGNYEKRSYMTGFTLMEGLEFSNSLNSSRSKIKSNFENFLSDEINNVSTEKIQKQSKRVKDFYFPEDEIMVSGFIDFYTDAIFSYAAVTSASLHSFNLAPTYLYVFSYNGSLNLPSARNSAVRGPGHIAQSLYILDAYYPGLYDNMTSDDVKIQYYLREMWANFIKFGNPTPIENDNISWWPVMMKESFYLNIDLELSMKVSPLEERINIWDEIYEYSIKTLPNSAATRNSAVFVFTIFVFLRACYFFIKAQHL